MATLFLYRLCITAAIRSALTQQNFTVPDGYREISRSTEEEYSVEDYGKKYTLKGSESNKNEADFSKSDKYDNSKSGLASETADAENSDVSEKPKISRTEKIFKVSEPSNSDLSEETAEEVTDKSLCAGNRQKYLDASESTRETKSHRVVDPVGFAKSSDNFSKYETPCTPCRIKRFFRRKIPEEVYKMSVSAGTSDTGANVRRIIEKLEMAHLRNSPENQMKTYRSSPIRSDERCQGRVEVQKANLTEPSQ